MGGWWMVWGGLVACGGAPPAPVQAPAPPVAVDPLPSWVDGAVKTRILDAVSRWTDEKGVDYVPPSQRVVVFDNDGTLWAEQPMYFQLSFAFDRVKQVAADHPEWATQEPFASVLRDDPAGVLAGGMEGLLTLLRATHGDLPTVDFEETVASWVDGSRHPTKGVRYTELTYVPMVELIDFLHREQFKVFIVSGGGIDFMRVWTEAAYGIPPERVVGSQWEITVEMKGDVPVLQREGAVSFIDDKEGKVLGIHRHIGQRPLAAFGNSDGDLRMIQYTTAGEGLRLGVLLHHTDGQREWAYDRDSHIGRLDEALTKAPEEDWVVIDMAQDWSQVFTTP